VFDEMYSPSYNCAPSQKLPVITNNDPEKLNYFKWGLVPFWSNDPKIGLKLINARAENILGKPSFKTAFYQRRCLIPTNGFFEWKKQGKQKIPYRIFLKTEEIFAIAGIWEAWKDTEGTVLNSFSIITTSPNKLMQDIHSRMPVILNQHDEQAWLFEKDETYLKNLLQPFDASKMDAYQVSSKLNSPANNSSEIIERVENVQGRLEF